MFVSLEVFFKSYWNKIVTGIIFIGYPVHAILEMNRFFGRFDFHQKASPTIMMDYRFVSLEFRKDYPSKIAGIVICRIIPEHICMLG
jgi:hypothetical protein